MSELIAIRALTESDLGIFAAHRASARSKQRAININSEVAREMLSPAIFAGGGTSFKCTFRCDGVESTAERSLLKVHKNWRLGGPKVEDAVFGDIDSRDFAVIRAPRHNTGHGSITVRFIGRAREGVLHVGLVSLMHDRLTGSMALFRPGDPNYDVLAALVTTTSTQRPRRPAPKPKNDSPAPVPPMPAESGGVISSPRSVKEKLRSPLMVERMLKAAADLSAPAQLAFYSTVEQLAVQLREILVRSGRIVKIEKNHGKFWPTLRGRSVGFVDGGLANLAMIGTAPIAARVGGYVVRPGTTGAKRERFVMLRHLIGELYAEDGSGVYANRFPDAGALRDAARITLEAAGALKLLAEEKDLAFLLCHGALVNPVSRYTDMKHEGAVVARFPDFSAAVVPDLLPGIKSRVDPRPRNFVSVHARQLEALSRAAIPVCGVVEREGTTSTILKAVLDGVADSVIADVAPLPPTEYRKWFRSVVDPADDEQFEGGRITDSLLFRCVLLEGEAIVPVEVDRNELRRAPNDWADVIKSYPRPQVSYMLPSAWAAPIRFEMFAKDVDRFREIALLVLHCSALLPRYSFPVGLDIVDKYAKVPDWMSRPVHTFTAVRALKGALDSGNVRLFDSLRRSLCMSKREWFLRPST